MKWTLIVNPHSGGGKAQKIWPRIASVLRDNEIDFEYYFTEEKSHGISLASELAKKGNRKFIAVGGDGILNEVVNGLCRAGGIPLSEFVLACIPIGSGCDWARTHNISTNINKSILLLKDPQIISHDVGRAKYNQADERYFINVAGLAFDAFVVKETEHLPVKGILGKFFYLYGLLVSLNRYPSHAFRFMTDDVERQGQFFCMNVGICKYCGGGMVIAPWALPDDALFDITVIEKMSPLEVILNLRYLFNGKIYDHRKISHIRSPKIRILPIKENIPFELDGEFIGDIPVEFDILNEKFTVVTGRK